MTILPDDKLSQSPTDTALENAAIRVPFGPPELVSASISPQAMPGRVAQWTLKQVQGDGLFGECDR